MSLVARSHANASRARLRLAIVLRLGRPVGLGAYGLGFVGADQLKHKSTNPTPTSFRV